MRNLLLYLLLSIMCVRLQAQILLEDLQGDRIANNAPLYTNTLNQGINTSLIKLNTGEQSLGFDYIVSSRNFDPSRYRIHEFGIKANSTNGVAAIFSNGQFSPEINFTYSLTQVPLLRDRSGWVDWAGINIGYTVSQYSLFSEDSTFDNQLIAENTGALSAMVNYNALVNSIWILHAKLGYARRNNFDNLEPVEVRDISTVTDPATGAIRQVVATLDARRGEFRKFHTLPIILSATHATPTDDASLPAAERLRLGYTVYVKNLLSSELPDTRAGVLFFLTRQDKSGVRAPVFGLDIQAVDPFDVYDAGNGFGNRLRVGFSSIFSL